jgi:1-acyl-sn-glycerol-3-phosphate acyltransferase
MKAARRFFLFRHWRNFFSLKVLVEEQPPPRSLFACFPHGVFPLGLFLASSISERLFPEPPKRKHVGAIASVFFWIPLLSNLLTWFGCVPAEQDRIKRFDERNQIKKRVDVLLVSCRSLNQDHSIYLLPEVRSCFVT